MRNLLAQRPGSTDPRFHVELRTGRTSLDSPSLIPCGRAGSCRRSRSTLAGRRCIMVVLTGLAGFTRLLGLGHFVWFPRPSALLSLDASRNYACRRAVRLLGPSLDGVERCFSRDRVADVIRYMSGDRELVTGLVTVPRRSDPIHRRRGPLWSGQRYGAGGPVQARGTHGTVATRHVALSLLAPVRGVVAGFLFHVKQFSPAAPPAPRRPPPLPPDPEALLLTVPSLPPPPVPIVRAGFLCRKL